MKKDLTLFLQNLRKHGYENEIPNISESTAEFLSSYIRDNSITSVLEIGSANGYSTIHLSQSVGVSSGNITSIEFSRHAYEEAMQNLLSYQSILQWASSEHHAPAHLPAKQNSGIDCCQIENIDYLFGNALEVLPCLLDGEQEFYWHHPRTSTYEISAKRFDMIFIDGMFRRTLDFFLLTTPLLISGGTVIVDDAVKYRWKMDGFYEYLDENNISYEIVHTDEDDGVMVIRNIG